MIFKDYYGNPVEFPIHIHEVSDTQRDGLTAIANSTNDGFMDNTDKAALTKVETDLIALEDKVKTAIFIKYRPATLIDGPSFNTAIKTIGPTATKVVFTTDVITSDKIPTATLVSTPESKHKAYMYLDGTTVYIASDEIHVTMFTNPNASRMFYDYNTITSIDFKNINTVLSTDMNSMFYDCDALTRLDLTNFNTINVTNMNRMFAYSKKLISINVTSFNTSKVTDMGRMFMICQALTSVDVSGFDTSNVTDMEYMFNNCNVLPSVYVSNFNTSKVTTMKDMFSYDKALTEIDLSGFDTSNVTDMAGMLSNCTKVTSLNVSGFNTSKVTSINGMFATCAALTTLDVSNFDLSNVTELNYMFKYCTKLETLVLPKITTSNLRRLTGTFFGDPVLKTIQGLSDINFNSVNITNELFTDCKALSGSITIANSYNNSYQEMFTGCSTDEGTSFVVNYKEECLDLATAMVGTRTEPSNVVLGSLVA